MNERHKLKEAHYFLEQMLAEHDRPMNFRFELSAFLGAARSVLQYAREEATAKPGGQLWYDQGVAREPVLHFFKDKRDANIHTAPATPTTTIQGRVVEYLVLDEETTIPYRHNTSTYRHTFADWPADETVAELSARYLNALEAFVTDGMARQLLSG